MIGDLIEKRDKVNKVLEKEGLLYRAGLIGDKIALIKKKGAEPIDQKIMTKIKKAAPKVEFQVVDEYGS